MHIYYKDFCCRSGFPLTMVFSSMKYFCILVLFYLKLTSSAPAADLITHLPGLSTMTSYKQYSGYLSAGDHKYFHYWFVESQSNPANDPVVLWLNGGPGCSSLDGYLSENGPLHVNDDGETLYTNPYSWNKIANVLYLESPAGVGYSYDDTGNVHANDDQVSLWNYQALVDFFKKFPEFSKNEFFVTGESYGGIYVPTLSIRIMEGSFMINFQGLAVGNGLSSYTENDRSLIFFAYYHGLFGESLKNELSQACCDNNWSRLNCDFTKPECQNPVAKAFNLVYNSGLNSYALYLDCYGGNVGVKQRYDRDMSLLFPNLNPKTRQAIMSSKLKTTHNLSLVPPCINATASTAWLNRGDVKEALHIASGLPEWSICSDAVGSEYARIYQNMTAQYNKLLKDPNLHILVYNGDTDMACNFLGDEWFVDDLKQPIKSPRAPWYVNGQVAGFVKTFDRITYTTIRGAGHMVPQWAPEYAYVMFENFIKNKPFTV